MVRRGIRSRGLPALWLLLSFPGLWSCAPPAAVDAGAGAPPVEVALPPVLLDGIPGEARVSWRGDPGALPVELRLSAGGEVRAETTLATLEATLELPAIAAGERLVLTASGSAGSIELAPRVLPGWLSVLPPVVAIVLALVFRQVLPALFAGVWLGGWLVFGGPLAGLARTLDHYLIDALADPSHATILAFSLLLGGMVGLMSRSGGTQGLVDALARRATSPRRGQLVTWLLGLAIFFDDYANTLLVGSTMRPVTDRLRLSREKLAYIVDSTAAPVAAIGLVSTWIGYEVSLIGDALAAVEIDRDAYGVFLRSIPYNFYPILALAFGLLVAATGRDFGAMRRAEVRAREGRVVAPAAVPLADFDAPALVPEPGTPRRWINAVVPVAVVLGVTFAGLWLTGRAALAGSGAPAASGLSGLGAAFSAGDSLRALLWASAAGGAAALALVVGQRLLSFQQALEAWLAGLKSMAFAVVILLLAWSIAAVCDELDTSGWLVAATGDLVSPHLLPALVFVVAAATSFATGTSWGTMAILVPLAVPTAVRLAEVAGMGPEASQTILLGAVSSVLAGAIFGDHCSPISDTTVLSSMASGCDHVDHVRTQLPYALVVAVVALALCELPAAWGVSPWLCLLVATAALAAVLFALGRDTDAAESAILPRSARPGGPR